MPLQMMARKKQKPPDLAPIPIGNDLNEENDAF
jgi:hypothetical protein